MHKLIALAGVALIAAVAAFDADTFVGFGGWDGMLILGNSLLTPSIIAKEALFQLENNIIMGDKVHRQYKNEFVTIGDTVTIRRPVKFKVSDGATRQNQDVIENATSITINKRKHVSWKFSSLDLTLTVAEYSERYIKPAMIALSNQVDLDLCVEGAREFYNIVGTPGTTPADFTILSAAGQRADELAIPDDGNRTMILNPAARWGLANGLGGTGSGGLFNADMVEEFTRRGYLGTLATFNIYGDQNVGRHQVGQYSGSPVTSSSVSNGASTVPFSGMTGAQTGALRKGDIITFAGVNSVNPVNFQDNGVLAEFVVTADVDTTGGAGTVPIFPAINDGSTASTAPYQNVTALPASGAAITVKTGAANSSAPQNLAFHRNALALVTVPLELPDSAVFKARGDWRGYSIRVIKDYDINEDEEIIRLDIMYGVKAIYPDIGIRVTG